MKFDNNPFVFNDKTIPIPHDVLLERTVLGLMLMSDKSVEIGMQYLQESYFPNVDNNHRAIFHAIKLLHEEQVAIDFLTVSGKLKELKLLSAIGGMEYLTALGSEAITFSAMKDYCLKLKDLNLLRNALKVIDNNLEIYRKGRVSDANDYVSDLTRDITKVAEERRIMDFESLGDVAKDLKVYLETMKESGTGKLTGSATGFLELDRYTHGFQEDNYVIIAARPAVGKTAFGLSLAYNMAVKNERTVGFFSLEMASRQLMQRLLSKVSGIQHKKILEGTLSARERVKIDETLTKLEKVPLYIDETPNININDLVLKARKLKRENDNLCAIFVDYIGLITTSGDAENRQLELSRISAQLKALARELKITVIAFSQLSRQVEARSDKKPMMSDLRESGSLEQDADQVFLMYREDYYIGQGTIKPTNAAYQAYYETLRASGDDNNISPVDIMLAKNRSGETANITLLFFKSISSFDNPDTGVLESLKAMQRAHASRGKSSE
ncbi:MAG: replicative DNA helicase [Bacilli bacterium]|nr:replicative DNA helicase [Bacilli bacterium]